MNQKLKPFISMRKIIGLPIWDAVTLSIRATISVDGAAVGYEQRGPRLPPRHRTQLRAL
jgi:hypothetical protein